MEPLGDSEQFFWHFVSCLYLEWSSKVLLEASGLDLGSISRGFGKDFGRVLHGFWEEISRNLVDSWLFWAFGAILTFLSILQGSLRIFCNFRLFGGLVLWLALA